MEPMTRLLEIMAKLRSPEGCPWDREQDHQSIRSQLIEECYELVEAIDKLDDTLMKEELGDVLLHVVFHSQLARERGAFTFEEVARGIADKLVRRHPHVFGENKLGTSEEVLVKWNELKKLEKPERTSVLAGIPAHLPALMKAQEVQKKAARVGFDWPEVGPVLAKIREEVDELEEALAGRGDVRSELGDLLFSVVNLSRKLKIDAEEACRESVAKFTRRFEWMEQALSAEGRDWQGLSLEELDRCWEKAKAAE